MFLIVIALHAFDGWLQNRASNRRVAVAWLLLSVVLLVFSFDEIGSLHARAGWIGNWSAWLTLLPFGLVFGAMIGYAVITLYFTPGQRTAAILIYIGFALLASMALQEYVEHNVDWTANRYLQYFKARLRPVVEEGSELLGMLVLFWAALSATGGLWRRARPAGSAALAGVVRLRRSILWTALVGAPALAYLTVIMPLSEHDHGSPADWPAAALYLLAALAAFRPSFESGRRPGAPHLVLFVVALLGCASTILPPDSPLALPVMTLLGAAAFLTWVVEPRCLANAYLPASILLALALAGAWIAPHSDVIVYTLAQYTGLAMYWVNSSMRTACAKTRQATGVWTSAVRHARAVADKTGSHPVLPGTT